MRGDSNRRQFLKTVAGISATAIGFPYVVPSGVFGAGGATAPSEKIVMGCIGVGSMGGGGHIRGFMTHEDVRVVAACDVRDSFRKKAKQRIDQHYGDNGCTIYDDFRELLARMDIDAVCIATPDHWHALIGIEAAKNKKDMYLEKPLDVNFAAGKVLREAVNRYGVIVQFGTQQRSSRQFRFACELVRNERIGKLHTIIVGSLPSWPFPNQPIQPVPDKKDFDYDMWLGPAPWAAYTYERCASRAMGTDGQWTFIHDYSLGGIGGAWGVHHVDIAQWGNNTDHTGPIEIEGSGLIPDDGLVDTATQWRVEHKYADGVLMIHTDFKNAAKNYVQFRKPTLHLNGCGILFLGTEGWVVVSRKGIDAQPKSLLTTIIRADEIHLPVSSDHRRNFLDSVKTRKQTVCPVETAVRSDTICHLDDIAVRLGRKLRWNPENEGFIDDDQANRMLVRPLRSPWHL